MRMTGKIRFILIFGFVSVFLVECMFEYKRLLKLFDCLKVSGLGKVLPSPLIVVRLRKQAPQQLKSLRL